MGSSSDLAKGNKNSAEKAIKIIANSTSYGIFIEILRDDAPKPERLKVFLPDGSERKIFSTALEEPGRYFHPIIGTLITGAARLMLGLAERLVLDQGLTWAFCDTDSLAIARPDEVNRPEFRKRTQHVIDWFTPLNPYEKPGSILQIEDVNHDPAADEVLQPLYAFAISAKRYALCNFDAQGRPTIRKASAHGLGHLMAPYRDDYPAEGIPAPIMPLEKIGVSRWQYDLWYKIIEAAQSDKPWQVPLDYHPALNAPAASRYTATSPELLKWMSAYNADKAQIEHVTPFCFMLRFMGKTLHDSILPEPTIIDEIKPGRPRKPRAPKPTAAFQRDPTCAAELVTRI